MPNEQGGRLALGAELAEAYTRLDQVEAALYAYYHQRLDAIRRGSRPQPEVDESFPRRIEVREAHAAVQEGNRKLFQTRQQALAARPPEP